MKYSIQTAALILLASATIAIAQPPPLIPYQGRLVNGTNLVNGPVNLTFRLYTNNVGGSALYVSTNQATAVDGLYASHIGDEATIGALYQALTNAAVWLEVEVNGTPLTPRERFGSVPYAMMVEGLRVEPNFSIVMNPKFANFIEPAAAYSVIGGGVNHQTYSPYSTIGGGGVHYIGTNSFAAIIAGGYNNAVGNNSFESTVGGGRVNWILDRAPHGFIGGGFNNYIENAQFATIAGGQANLIWQGASHATIGGGASNHIQAVNGMIGGGLKNLIHTGAVASVISGGQNNTVVTNASRAVIGGGGENRNEAVDAVIGGGRSNIIRRLAQNAVIGGGQANLINTGFWYSVIGGGLSNQIIGGSSVIPGGRDNIATDFSFAAGRQAHALHSGSFVWADNRTNNFATTSNNQFLARANFYGFGRNYSISGSEVFGIQSPATGTQFGGMYINTAGTNAIPFYGYAQGDNIAAWHSVDANRSWQLVMGGFTRLTVLTNGFVGIGTATPTNRLHVAGAAQATSFITGSDRNMKENIHPVAPDEILEKVVNLPIATWTFKEEPSGTHIGPMAQDFYAAFGFGNTDTGIATVDADGVALASIQALARRLDQLLAVSDLQQERIDALEIENARLREDLELMLRALSR
ncbi:MAG TPA: tail fiber domain-containing protein [Kiritimatiellia bacterium]|nr:tail fiber domain-containing protein [Kiritimatiellia bacterium]HMO99466.1 tail fiber domain-containing protein [Kiritimatiellia bacterium]HMP97372.1 tail fiber domain-containing protein [Kiritimatiellia bacterium]